MNNSDMSNLMAMLSNMNPKDLENSIAKANQILQNNSKEDILNQLKNGFKNS